MRIDAVTGEAKKKYRGRAMAVTILVGGSIMPLAMLYRLTTSQINSLSG
jgi:hypothetical protein